MGSVIVYKILHAHRKAKELAKNERTAAQLSTMASYLLSVLSAA